MILQGTTYWTDLFVRHFLFQAEHTIDGDDLLFFVRKKHVKTSSRYLPKFETEVDVFRKDSKKLPIGDPDIDWEETVYLNLVVHQFDYTLTLAICTRTSPKELQVSRSFVSCVRKGNGYYNIAELYSLQRYFICCPINLYVELLLHKNRFFSAAPRLIELYHNLKAT